jgi:hypothetical protein
VDRGGAALGIGIAGLTLVVAFDAGGAFPDTTGFIACGLLVALALWIVSAEAPLAGWGRGTAAAGLPLLGLAGWSLLSAVWSGAAVRAGDAAVRALVYALVLGLAGAAAGRPGRLRWVARGIALPAAAIGTAALATRVAPRTFPTAPGVLEDRLAFPLTYWNALGLLMCVGIVVVAGLSADRGEPLPVRVAAAAALPVLAATLYLTLSRGAIAVTVLGLLVLVAAAPRAAWPAVALATVAPVGAAVAAIAASAALARGGGPGDAGAGLAVIACAALAAVARWVVARRLEARLAMPRLHPVVLAAALVAVLGVGAVGVLRASDATGGGADPRARLASTSTSERSAYWRTALAEAGREPVHGTGAGTFAEDWVRERPRLARVQYAHSLYLETFGELGVVGLLLVLAAAAAMLTGLARRARGPDGVAAAALLAAGAAWAVHAGIDWDWQVPAVTLWVPAAAGVALARGGAAAWRPALPVRAAIGAALIAAALGPWVLAVAERRSERALAGYDTGNCAAAVAAARQGPVRRPAAEIVEGLCRARAGQPGAAAEVRRAIAADPGGWEGYLALGEVLAASGADPRPALHEAQRRNPLEPAVLAALAPGADVTGVPLVIDGLDRPALGPPPR